MGENDFKNNRNYNIPVSDMSSDSEVQELRRNLENAIKLASDYKQDYHRVIEENDEYFDGVIKDLKEEISLKDLLIEDMKLQIQDLQGIIEKYRLSK